MARYTYNAGLVTQTIDTLYTACDCLDSTNVDIKKGIDMIFNARGAENMKIDFSPITGYQSTVIEYIELMANELQKKAQEIEEYQESPWYKKLFASVGMGALKIVEGLATFVEDIGDGFVSIGGFVGGLFSSEIKNSAAEYVRTDHVGDAFAKGYEGDGVMGWINDNSYFSHESTAANVLKGVGTAAGYVIVTVATGGAGAAASTAVAAGAAALGGIGSGTQNALKQAQLANPEMSAGEAFNSAFAQGVKQGAIAAGVTLVTAGVAKGLSNAATSLQNGDDVIKVFANVADKTDDMGTLAKVANSAKAGVNKAADKILNNTVGKAIVNGTNKVLTGAGNVLEKPANKIISNAGSGVIGNVATKAAENFVKAGGTAIVSNAVGSVAGASGQFKKNTESSTLDQYIYEAQNPSIAQNLYEKTQDVLKGESAKPGIATAEEAAQNLQNLQAQGYNPGADTSTDTTIIPEVEAPSNDITSSNGVTSSNGGTTSSGGGTSGGGYTANSNPVELPDYPTTTPGNNAMQNITPTPTIKPTPVPTMTVKPTTTYPTVNQNDIVSNINPVSPGNNGNNINNGGNAGGGTSHISTGQSNISESVKESAGSEVLNTFGDVSSSFAELSGNKSNIPTSSAPILSSTDEQKSSKSFVPLGAGLGAASIAGIGAKAYMDKREKSKETESNEIETEEWAEKDNVEIDYGLETSEEADYLSPSDELAFTE